MLIVLPGRIQAIMFDLAKYSVTDRSATFSKTQTHCTLCRFLIFICLPKTECMSSLSQSTNHDLICFCHVFSLNLIAYFNSVLVLGFVLIYTDTIFKYVHLVLLFRTYRTKIICACGFVLFLVMKNWKVDKKEIIFSSLPRNKIFNLKC